VPAADVGAVELLGDGDTVVETDLLQELAEGAEVNGVGVAEGAVDVEQDGFQRPASSGRSRSRVQIQTEGETDGHQHPAIQQERSPRGEDREETRSRWFRRLTCRSPCPPEPPR